MFILHHDPFDLRRPPPTATPIDLSATSDRALRPERESPIIDMRDLFDMRGTLIVMGGTYDPFHEGHATTGVAIRHEIVRRSIESDPTTDPATIKFMFMPTHQNPSKLDPPVANDEQRLQLIVQSIKSIPGVFVTPLELRLMWDPAWQTGQNELSTLTTIEFIRRLIHRDANLIFAIGAEYVSELHAWAGIHNILEQATVAIQMRKGYEQASTLVGPHAVGSVLERAAILKLSPAEVDKLDKNVLFVDSLKLAATQIRAALQAWNPSEPFPELVEAGLSPGARAYLREHASIYSARK